MVFAELPAEVAVVQQAEDRAHRQGQQLPVNVYFLLARGTTDDRRWASDSAEMSSYQALSADWLSVSQAQAYEAGSVACWHVLSFAGPMACSATKLLYKRLLHSEARP